MNTLLINGIRRLCGLEGRWFRRSPVAASVDGCRTVMREHARIGVLFEGKLVY